MLIDYGADVNVADFAGHTALHTAFVTHQREIADVRLPCVSMTRYMRNDNDKKMALSLSLSLSLSVCVCVCVCVCACCC